MSPEILIAFLAAFVGAIMNAIPGGGTFLTYPVLLALGSNSIVANATSTVVLWPGIVSSLPGYKKEIIKSKTWIKILIIPAVVGAIVGSFILTHTPSSVFDWIAPILIIIGASLLQFQEPVNRLFKKIHLDQPKRKVMFVGLLILIVAIYGSYFGAGIGILLLGCLSVLGIKDMYQNIGLKNVISLIVNFVAIIYFSLSGIVHWQIVPIMALGAVIGGYTGSHLVRFVNRQMLRTGVVILGYTIAVILFLSK